MGVYAKGTHARAMCDVCGFEVAYTELRMQWNGFMACGGCFDSRHPQDTPRAVSADAESLRNARPDNDDQDASVYQYSDNHWELNNP